MKAKIHEQGPDTVLACADEELIGSTLVDGDIEFTISKKFYDGKRINETQLSRLLEQHCNINLVGQQTVRVAIEKKIIDAGDVRSIQGIPHVQIFQF